MSDIQDGSVDWIYIDGNHSYEFVKEDLKWLVAQAKKWRILMCGDDYIDGKYQVEHLKFGVVQAVDEFVSKESEICHSELIKDQFVFQKSDLSLSALHFRAYSKMCGQFNKSAIGIKVRGVFGTFSDVLSLRIF